MVARTLLTDFVEGANLDPFVEPARGEGVVELAIGLKRVAPVLYPCRHIPCVSRHIGLLHGRLPSIRRLRPQEFQTERCHPVPVRFVNNFCYLNLFRPGYRNNMLLLFNTEFLSLRC